MTDFGPNVVYEISTDELGRHSTIERQVPMTDDEIAEAKARIAKAKLDNQKQEWQEIKAQLIQSSLRLEQAKVLQGEGIDAADVQAIQKEVNRLKEQLNG